MATYLVDIDGTVADTSHRQWALYRDEPNFKPNWELFFNLAAQDKPFPHMQTLLADLNYVGASIVYCSGRPERFREMTSLWLIDNGYPFPKHLFMRKDGDHRPDQMVKIELLQEIREQGFIPVMAFDDRNSVVKMWRAAGLPCLQVAEGDF